ncbi:MAG TPA: hypothetical protein VGZ02_14270 [Candidatus Baltobacteraceae bacterium]|nr:hypothetical protein [Candidatus Baltobacteraceae bacterium]
MKRALLSLPAAAIGLGLLGSVAAAPISAPPSQKPSPKPSSGSKPGTKATPGISKWQQRINQMLKVSAPGDEYFGRMKMSYLGINNTFRDDLVRAGAYTTDPKILSGINFADEALTAWARKYPNDPQLARSYFLAFEMYRKVWVQEYQDKAWNYAHIVIRKWPGSFFGKALGRDLKIGFTEHYFADPEPCPEVTPEASETPNRHPTPTPSPTETPSPTPTPSPRPGMPPAQILPVPCFTPSPVPTVAPIVTPSGSPIPIPSGAITPSPAASGSPASAPSSSPSPASGGSSVPSATPSPASSHRPNRR